MAALVWEHWEFPQFAQAIISWELRCSVGLAGRGAISPRPVHAFTSDPPGPPGRFRSVWGQGDVRCYDARAVRGWERLGEAWERHGRGWERLGEAGRGWERQEEAGRGKERLGRDIGKERRDQRSSERLGEERRGGERLEEVGKCREKRGEIWERKGETGEAERGWERHGRGKETRGEAGRGWERQERGKTWKRK